MGKLTIQDLVSVLTEKKELSKKEAQRFVSTVFDLIQEGVERDKLVKIKGLGTFKVIGVEARESVNVNTGERVVIDSHLKVSFTPDTMMKELVNKPFSGFETVVVNEGVDFDDIPMPSETPETEEWQEPESTVAEVQPTEPEEPQPTEPEVQPTEPEEPFTEPETAMEESPIEEPVQVPVEEETTEEPPVEDTVTDGEEIDVPAEHPNVAEEEPIVEEEEAAQPEETPTVLEENTPEPKDEQEKPEDKPAESQHNPEEPKSEPSQNHRGVRAFLLALLACCICFAAGYYLGQRQNPTDVSANKSEEQTMQQPQLAEKDSTAQTQTDTSQTVKPDTTVAVKADTQAQQAATTSENVDWKAYEAKDIRLRYGAYRIVGTEEVVQVREGDTPAKISRRYLGEGMDCYLEVYNGIKASTPLKVGQEIKIPKLKQKQKRNQ